MNYLNEEQNKNLTTIKITNITIPNAITALLSVLSLEEFEKIKTVDFRRLYFRESPSSRIETPGKTSMHFYFQMEPFISRL